MANLGPGLGEIIGPAGNYNSLNDLTKWVLSFGMLTGRLEIFTVFVFSAIFGVISDKIYFIYFYYT